jgi:hypothetical protein
MRDLVLALSPLVAVLYFVVNQAEPTRPGAAGH